MLRRACAVIVAILLLGTADSAGALFHLTVIDELMTSYNGDPAVQFVEVRMLAASQTFVAHSVFAAFDRTGAYVGDILEVPANVSNGGQDVRWLIGTAAFQSASGITPDFIMPAGILPTGGGMVCFGGGGGISPKNPPDWDRANFATYVDCVAYGSFAGASNSKIGTPTSLTADGHGLQRTSSTNDNATDFACADPATPENNAGMTGSLPETAPCQGAAPTPTATSSGGPTPTPPPAGGCIGDCSGNGSVEINELILGVNIAIGSAPLSQCPSFDANHSGMIEINELVEAVNNGLSSCPRAG